MSCPHDFLDEPKSANIFHTSGGDHVAIRAISKLWLKLLYASHEANSTISVGMDIANDFSQPNGCDIIIGREAN